MYTEHDIEDLDVTAGTVGAGFPQSASKHAADAALLSCFTLAAGKLLLC